MSSNERTLADELRSYNMGVVWSVVFAVVVIICGIFTPWGALQQLLANQGVGEEGQSVLAFVAGYTLPLSLGTGIVSLLFLRGAHRGHGFIGAVGTVAVILGGAGLLARALGLGLLPDYTGVTSWIGGAPGLLFVVLRAYFNAYGWALAVSATAIGFASAMQVERWIHESKSLEG